MNRLYKLLIMRISLIYILDLDEKEISYPDVFLINATKDIVMFMYDDRGCEVIAKNKEIIRDLYKKYKEWIPDYERESIDNLFK